MLRKRFRSAEMVLLLFCSAGIGLVWSESLIIVNRTGFDIEMVQGASVNVDTWGADLISSSMIRNRESGFIQIEGSPPYALRFLDTEGTFYVRYAVNPGSSGKVIVGPEHQARLAAFAGAEREVQFSNRTGGTISSMQLSSSSRQTWGQNLLNGRIIRDGETSTVHIQAVPGTLSFDLRFTLSGRARNGESGRNVSNETIYEKKNLILTDGAIVILSVPAGE